MWLPKLFASVHLTMTYAPSRHSNFYVTQFSWVTVTSRCVELPSQASSWTAKLEVKSNFKVDQCTMCLQKNHGSWYRSDFEATLTETKQPQLSWLVNSPYFKSNKLAWVWFSLASVRWRSIITQFSWFIWRFLLRVSTGSGGWSTSRNSRMSNDVYQSVFNLFNRSCILELKIWKRKPYTNILPALERSSDGGKSHYHQRQ